MLAGDSLGDIPGVAGEEAPLPRPDNRGDGRSCGDPVPFCLVRFICTHRSGWSRWKDSCRYAPASGPLVTRRNPYRFSCRWNEVSFV